MTVHSNDPVVCVVMNAVSNHPTASPPIQAPHPNQQNLLACAQPSLSASVASAVSAAAVAATAVVAVPTSSAASGPPSYIHNSSISMAVTTSMPPGARPTSPSSAAVKTYGCSITGGAGLSSSTAGSTSNVAGPPGAGTQSSLHSSAPAVNRCCDSGRTIYTDPVSGQTLCSCQYDILNYQRIAAAGGLVAGPGNVPIGAYPEGMSAYLSGIGSDQPPFYASPAGLDLKENLVGGVAPWPYPSVYHHYDAAFAGYPFSSYGIELNNSRRKNATRETTSTLKAWLNEHKKNPYPTKGEKIMLAIITKMTLTQVSTWFANARRRLKKENKMTWEPRNRVDDDDGNIDDDDHKSTDDNDLLDAKDSGLGSNEDKDRSGRIGDMLGDRPGEGNNSEWSGSRPCSPNGSPDIYDRPGGIPGNPLFHHAALNPNFPPSTSSPPDISAYHHQQLQQHHQQAQQQSIHAAAGSTSVSLAIKPRIWSLADMAKDGKDTAQKESPLGQEIPFSHSTFYGHPGQHVSPGKLLSPLAARIPNYSPYMRPDLYRGFYGAGAAAHVVGSTQEFIEHQRTFGANLAANNSLGMNPLLWKAAVSGASGTPFAPLSLTTNNHQHQVAPPSGASPSASSTSSSLGCDVVQMTPTSGIQSLQHHRVGPISGNSTSSSTSSNSGKHSPGINVTSLSGNP